MQMVNEIEFLGEKAKSAVEMLQSMREYQELIQYIITENDKGRQFHKEDIIEFNGRKYKFSTIASYINSFASMYNKLYVRGFGLPKIAKQGEQYYLGSFDEDYIDLGYSYNDLYNSGKHDFEEISLKDGKQTVLVCENGLICHDMEFNITRYFSLRDLDDIVRRGYFHTDIAVCARKTLNLHFREDIAEHIDGFRDNMLAENLRIATVGQNALNKYGKGYVSRSRKEYKHDSFKVIFIYRGKLFEGRKCDNEIAAACERYKLENEVVSDEDRAFLYNVKNNHLNLRSEVEQYIKGEITLLGLQKKTLELVACNPFLVFRYNLAEECRKFCINIEPFKMSEDGYIINQYGVSFSQLADYYAKGLLTREEILNQGNIKSIECLTHFKDMQEQEILNDIENEE